MYAAFSPNIHNLYQSICDLKHILYMYMYIHVHVHMHVHAIHEVKVMDP